MRVRVLGCGNWFAGDDAVGLQVAREVRRQPLPAGVDVIEVGGGGLSVLPLLAGIDKAILVDAMMSGAQVGIVRRYAAPDLVPQDAWRFSTHQLDLAEALQLGHQFQPEALPRELVVVGIEIPPPMRFHLGLSRAVAEAVPMAVEMILRDLREPVRP